jgi:hypothetical protein
MRHQSRRKERRERRSKTFRGLIRSIIICNHSEMFAHGLNVYIERYGVFAVGDIYI